MLYNDLDLPADVQQAIDHLIAAGMVVVTEALLEDCRKSDGSRFRTFSLSGRHDLALIVKDVKALKGFTVKAPDPVELKDLREFEEAEAAGLPRTGDAELPEENFWLDRHNWKWCSGDEFYPLVAEDQIDALIDAPADVQAAVKKKFDRLCDKPWPLS